MNKKVIAVVLVILVVGAFLVLSQSGMFGGNSKEKNDQSKIEVATSFYPLYYFSGRIAGDRGDIMNITPAGAEPHDYEPTAQDIARIENSDVLVLNGGGLEVWGEKIKSNIASNQTVIIEAGEGLTTQEVVEDGETIVDPHIWLSPKLAEQMVDKILEGLIRADKENTDYYTSNANILKGELATLNNEYMSGLSVCKSRDIITSHAAFGYLASTYNLNQVAITGISPDAEPSPKELADVAKFAKENNVKYIFFEELVSPKLSQTVANEIGAETLVLNPLEGLAEEELAEGKNYFTEMRDNLANLKLALQCTQ